MRNSINPHKDPFQNHWNIQLVDRMTNKSYSAWSHWLTKLTLPVHWVSACKLVSLQAGFHINLINQFNLRGVHLWGTFAKPSTSRGSSGIFWALSQNQWGLMIAWRYQPSMETDFFAIFFTFLKKEIAASISSLVKKCLFYTCTNCRWLIRVNAEAMLSWSLKLCSWT